MIQTNIFFPRMIEQVRKAIGEKQIDLKVPLKGKNNDIHDEYAREVYLHLMKTRRRFESFLTLLQSLQADGAAENKDEGDLEEIETRQTKLDLTKFFINVQRAASSIVKGALLLRTQGTYEPQADTAEEFDIVTRLTDEANQIVDYCKTMKIPCFHDEFLRRVLVSYGFKEFKKIVEDEEFSILKNHPVLFEQAFLHQQGDPAAYLRSKAGFVRKTVNELKAKEEFRHLLPQGDEIFINAALTYQERFSNPYDYVFHIVKLGRKKPRSVPEPIY